MYERYERAHEVDDVLVELRNSAWRREQELADAVRDDVKRESQVSRPGALAEGN